MKAQSLLLLLEQLYLTDAEQLLDYGIKTNQVDMVRRALATGEVVPNESNLIEAARYGSIDVVKIFLDEFNIDINKGQETALYTAVSKDNKDMINLILSYGADVNKKIVDGWAPIHYGVIYGSPEIIKILLDAGADPNIRTDMGNTPLNLATYRGKNKEIADMLRQYGAA